MVECLHGMCGNIGSIPGTAREKEKKRKEEEREKRQEKREISLLCLLERKRRHGDGKGRTLANGSRGRMGSGRKMKRPQVHCEPFYWGPTTFPGLGSPSFVSS